MRLEKKWYLSLLLLYHRISSINLIPSLVNFIWPSSVFELPFLYISLIYIIHYQSPSWLVYIISFYCYLDEKVMVYLPNISISYFSNITTPYWMVFRLSTILFFFLTWLRRFLLRKLFSYHYWMYDGLNKISLKTRIWIVVTSCLKGMSKPYLYSSQEILPYLPLPNIDDTLKSLSLSVQGLYGTKDKRMHDFRRYMENFKKKSAWKLQLFLRLKHLITYNYVSDWWEKYIYLMYRSSIVPNSNYYALSFQNFHPTNIHSAKLAGKIYSMLRVKEVLEREQLDPLFIRGMVPVCMNQYKRLFSVTRIPRPEVDEIRQFGFDKSNHLVVLCHGFFYRLPVYYANRLHALLEPCQYQAQIEYILMDATKRRSELPKEKDAFYKLAAMTQNPRDNWARWRREFFHSGINKSSLETIESAICYMVLAGDLDSPNPIPLSERTHSTRAFDYLTGRQYQAWADKNVTFFSDADGEFGLHAEHSWADALTLGHFTELVFHSDFVNKDRLYDELTGNCKGFIKGDHYHLSPDLKPQLLEWELKPGLSLAIKEAVKFSKETAANVDISVFIFDAFGKGFIKKAGMSPDAFIQCAFQLAYHQIHGGFAPTYESAVTRLFRNGRTETVRSLTPELRRFILSFDSFKGIKFKESSSKHSSTSNSEEEEVIPLHSSEGRLKCLEFLKQSCSIHQKLYRDAMAGKGCDRHLFALYVASKAIGKGSKFLESVLTEPWLLATSQQPQRQSTFMSSSEIRQYGDMFTPGGGFGPVAKDGYGISYMIPDDDRIIFHICSFKASEISTTHKYKQSLEAALLSLKDLVKPDNTLLID